MSDLLLVGLNPESKQGEEYFLHCMDWWYEIVMVLQQRLEGRFAFDEHFRRDMMLALPTPTLGEEDCKELGKLVSEMVRDGSAEAQLERIYREDPFLIQAQEEDPDGLHLDPMHRLEQIRELAIFLDQCGGCKAKWHGVEDSQ